MHLLNCIAVAFLLLCSACQMSFSEAFIGLRVLHEGRGAIPGKQRPLPRRITAQENGHHSENSSESIPCLSVDFCPEAAKCCHFGVDDYGWIAAAVGWSLWFLTLILFCIDKLTKLQPDEPKDLGA